MVETLTTQLCFLVALISIGTESILQSASLPRYSRRARANLVNFFLFTCVSCTALVILIAAFRRTTPAVLVIVASISLASMLFVIIWLVPERHRRQPPSSEVSTKRIFLKAVCSLIVFGVPIAMGVHLHKYRDYYLANVAAYGAVMAKASPTGEASLNSAGNVLFQYFAAVDLHFLTTAKLQCAQSDTDCGKVQNLLIRSQSNRAIFLLKIIFFFVCLYLLFRYYGDLVELRYKRRPRVPGDLGLQSDVIEQCAQIVAISAAFLLALMLSGVDFSSLGIFAGLIGAGLSVAMKDVLGNVVAGVLLLWGKTIKANDVITIPRSESSDTGATYGVVRRMTMRYTIIEDRNEVRRLIPNSKLTDNTIENWTHEDRSVRLRVLVDVDYLTDLRHARTVLESVCYEVPKIDTKKQPPKAVVTGFGESAIHMSLRFWVNEPHRGIRPILSDVYIAISERFREEGIKIPYPQMELQMKAPPIEPE